MDAMQSDTTSQVDAYNKAVALTVQSIDTAINSKDITTEQRTQLEDAAQRIIGSVDGMNTGQAGVTQTPNYLLKTAGKALMALQDLPYRIKQKIGFKASFENYLSAGTKTWNADTNIDTPQDARANMDLLMQVSQTVDAALASDKLSQQQVTQLQAVKAEIADVVESANELTTDNGNDTVGVVESSETNTTRAVEIPKPTKVAEFYPYMCEIGKRTDLNVQEKVQILQEAYYDLGDGNRKNIHCQIDAKFLKENGFTKNGYSDYDWPDRWGFRDDYESITRENNKLPDIMDRNGSLGGNTFTELPIDRAPYTYDEMSLPYIRNPEANHRAVYDRPDGYYFDVINAIRNNDLDGLNALLDMNGIESIDEVDMHRLNSTYYDFLHDAKSRGINKDVTYGIYGYANEWINELTGEVYLKGGAPQYTLPLNVIQLFRLGVYKQWR